MKKPYSFSEVDKSRRCVDCGKALKRNLLTKHPDAERCYVHWVRHENMESRRENMIRGGHDEME